MSHCSMNVHSVIITILVGRSWTVKDICDCTLAIPLHQEVLNFENDVDTSLGLAPFRRCIPCVNMYIFKLTFSNIGNSIHWRWYYISGDFHCFISINQWVCEKKNPMLLLCPLYVWQWTLPNNYWSLARHNYSSRRSGAPLFIKYDNE